MGASPYTKNVVDPSAAGSSVEKLIPVFVAVGCVLIALVCVAVNQRRKIANEEKQIGELRHDVSNLKESLRLVKEYNQMEQDMIEKEIDVFKKDFKKSGGGGEAGLEKLLIDPRELDIKETLGKGSFGQVFRGTYRGNDVAVKTLLQVDESSIEHFRLEILLM